MLSLSNICPALSNITAQPLESTLQVTDSEGRPTGEHHVLVSAHGTKVLNLDELQLTANRQGGLRISYNGPADALVVNGHLQDVDLGYSASIPFTHAPSSSEPVRTISFARTHEWCG